VRRLRDQFQGHVVLEGDGDWDTARLAWNLAADQHPALVVFPDSAADVIEIVKFARANGLGIAAQGTGHGAGPLGPLEDAVLVKTGRMQGLSVDPHERRARAESGVRWIEVTAAASEYGLAGLAGSSPNVGVVGYSLGGGLSFLGRRYGLAAASVDAIELVTADAESRRVDAEHEAELFWALRGGGGNFGVVTAIEFALYPVSEVYAGALVWPVERAAEILKEWGSWILEVPDEMTSLGRILHLPPMPEIPDFLRGRSLVVLELVYIGEEEEGAKLIRPLRELRPEIDTMATMPASRLSELHMDPTQPVPAVGDGMLLREFTAEASSALDRAVGAGTSCPLISIEVRHLGGAFAQPAAPCACTLDDARFALYAVGMAMSQELEGAMAQHIISLQAALAPWGTGRGTPNFADAASDSGTLFPSDVYERLRRVRQRYDLGGLFRANHPVQV